MGKKEKLKKYRDKWQKRLNLSHWTIHVAFGDFDEDNKHGEVQIHLSDDIAEILIVREIAYDWVVPYDLEFILLHEMLHIVFEVSPDKDLQEIMFERGLNRVARCLLELDRNGTS